MPRCRAAMGWTRRLRLRPPRLDGVDALIAGAAALGAALVMARMWAHGVGLNQDSLFYVELARNVLAGEGYTNYDGTIHTIWPPGYPLLLAIAGLGIVDPRDVAGPLNAVLFGATILVAGRYLRGRLGTPFLALWGCLAIALAVPLADLARFAMPNAPFILFATLALIQTDRALRDGSRSALAWAAIFCVAAWQMRYIGVAVAALTGAALLLQGGMPLPRRLRRAALFAAAAGAPTAAWLLWTYLETGRLFHNIYGVNQYPLTSIGREAAQILASWGQPLPGWLFAAVFAGLMLWLGVFMARGSSSGARRACLIFGGFALGYAALQCVATAQGYTWHGLKPRYIAVLYIPLVVVATFALDGLFGWARARRAAAGNASGLRLREHLYGGGYFG